jgi:dihydrofolate synthase/folylpolyglutamate synthase
MVSVITSLSYDHTKLLGDTLADIAYEKAGIIKPDVPVVSAPQHLEALEVLETVAAERGAPLTLVGRDWTYTPGAATESKQTFTAGPAGGKQRECWTPLLGVHQVINSTVAMAALDTAARAGLPITPQAVCCGLRRVDWPGRLEVIRHQPRVVLDAAHNAESGSRLRDALESLFPRRKLFLVFGASVDKDIAGMFKALLPITDHLVLSQAVHPRAHKTDDLAEAARAVDPEADIVCIASVREALDHALRLAASDDLICVTGSLFVVGEVRDICNLEPGHAVYLDAEPATTTQEAGV